MGSREIRGLNGQGLADNIVLLPEASQTLPSHYLLSFSYEGSCDATELPSKCRARASSTGASAGDKFLLINFNPLISFVEFSFTCFYLAFIITNGSCELREAHAGAFYRTAVGCEKNAIVLDVPGTESNKNRVFAMTDFSLEIAVH